MEAEERPQKLRKLKHDYGHEEFQPRTAEIGLSASQPGTSKREDAQTNGRESQYDTEEDQRTADNGNQQQTEGSHDKTDTQDSPDIPEENASPQLSKNQQKKLRKRRQWEEGRDYRKAKRKQKTVEKREKKREERKEAEAKREASGLPVNQPRPRRQVRVPVTILIDCGFDDLMAEKEIISLGSQLTRSYSDNSKAPFQVHLLISSWGGKLKARFETVLSKHHENWRGVQFLEDDFVKVAEQADKDMRASKGGKLAGIFEKYAKASETITSSSDVVTNGDATDAKAKGREVSTPPDTTAAPSDVRVNAQANGEAMNENAATTTARSNQIPEGEIIYLTSDSPHTIEELKPYSTYIVGGLVDKNRHKGICYKTAVKRGIKTAKLPIGEYLEMQTRSVLATNHVVEIMLRWLECGDWGEAFMKVIPKRKGGKLKQVEDAEYEEESPSTVDAS